MNTTMSVAQSAQQSNRGPGGQYSFGTHAEPAALVLAASDEALQSNMTLVLNQNMSTPARYQGLMNLVRDTGAESDWDQTVNDTGPTGMEVLESYRQDPEGQTAALMGCTAFMAEIPVPRTRQEVTEWVRESGAMSRANLYQLTAQRAVNGIY